MEQSCQCLLGSPLATHASLSVIQKLALTCFFLSFCASPPLPSVFLRNKVTAQRSSLAPLSYSPSWKGLSPTTPTLPQGCAGASPSPEPPLTSPCARPCPCSPAELGAAAGGDPRRAGRGEEEEGAREAVAGNRKQDCEQPGTGSGRSLRRLCCPLLPSAPAPVREHGAGGAPVVPRPGHQSRATSSGSGGRKTIA